MLSVLIYAAFQKVDHPTDSKNFVKPNRFSKKLNHWKKVHSKQTYNITTTPIKASCRTTCGKFKFKFCDKLQKACLMKRNISFHTVRQTKFTTVARNVCLLPAYTLEDAYATRQLHRQWRSGSCRAKRPANASSVRQCCAVATDALADGCRPVSCNWPN